MRSEIVSGRGFPQTRCHSLFRSVRAGPGATNGQSPWASVYDDLASSVFRVQQAFCKIVYQNSNICCAACCEPKLRKRTATTAQRLFLYSESTFAFLIQLTLVGFCFAEILHCQCCHGVACCSMRLRLHVVDVAEGITVFRFLKLVLPEPKALVAFHRNHREPAA